MRYARQVCDSPPPRKLRLAGSPVLAQAVGVGVVSGRIEVDDEGLTFLVDRPPTWRTEFDARARRWGQVFDSGIERQLLRQTVRPVGRPIALPSEHAHRLQRPSRLPSTRRPGCRSKEVAAQRDT